MSTLQSADGLNWLSHDNQTFQAAPAPTPRIKLPIGIYTPQLSLTGWYLNKEADSYEFPYKVYNYEQDFIQRIRSTFLNTTKNLGILLNGFKGAGKSVTAKLVCNELQLPVIIINKYINGVEQYIATIDDDIIVFIDEYEKVFSKELQQIMLSLMDGANDMHGRKLFLLTTNQLTINENMISRPGRIRYIKTYRDLDTKIISAIIEDSLIHKEFTNSVTNFISRLKLISIDLVKAIINEVNLYKEDPRQFAHYFNAEVLTPAFKLSALTFNKDNSLNEFKTVEWQVRQWIDLDDIYPGRSIYMDNKSLGEYIGSLYNDPQICVVQIYTGVVSSKIIKGWLKQLSYTVSDNTSFDRMSLVNDDMIKLYIEYHGIGNEYDDEDKITRTAYDIVYEKIKSGILNLIAIHTEEVDGYHSSYTNHMVPSSSSVTDEYIGLKSESNSSDDQELYDSESKIELN